QALFIYMVVVLFGFMAYTLSRMMVREGVPASERRMGFRNLLRTSTFFNKLAAPPSDKGD
ncbi:MAG: MFS transporter, partial [Rhizobium sp.]|nr:MFS transporter [Rhizobium sp.]